MAGRYVMFLFYSAAEKQQLTNSKPKNGTPGQKEQQNPKPDPTWVHDIFQGTLTNETRCLNCETVSA